ncbi:Elongation factor 3 [Monoraphidium neglectum]|uniref:Elongation factor 3 n=1 Tax=Monoraphidium neglectum TaxID=145388 RepID=A0A0D2LLV0_9CHLO|nr:Elongation factor 3 [Monoraphidium neglectum]KIY92769.1 Elongation factor 3 [Monoraphidium neglectum]|eukprot:XP_013891789.1 Elongation factor 3 [Monoraphidium neglectum]
MKPNLVAPTFPLRSSHPRTNVEKFLADFGLESEFSCHSNIRGLSGGQKVKLVLAAAMWNSPHLLIMDEPTNYLDRDSLGALATAIREFDGGVVLISHNSEFTSTCCHETWFIRDGKVEVVSAYATKLEEARAAAAAMDVGGDANGA